MALAQIKVRVERVLFPREGAEGSWYILLTDRGACKGTMRWRPEPNELLAMAGTWGEYKGSPEFKFKEVWHDLPADPRALLTYACELTPGIGPKTEIEIWEKLGANWPQIGHGDVPKLRAAALSALQETIARLELEKEKTEAIAWLMSKGATRRMSESAWGAWGEKTIGVVTSDPYRMAELPNYSFRDVDSGFRQTFGIEDGDPRRGKSAVWYAMRQLADGPTAVPWWALRDKVIALICWPLDAINRAVAAMFTDGTLHAFAETQHIALRKDFDDEFVIWKYANGGGEVAI